MVTDPRVAIVTGGGTGIGAATARRFVAGGDRVLVAGLDGAQLRALCEELGPDAAALELDVAAPDAGARLLERAREAFGRVDVLVNAAGTVATAPAESLTPDAWRRTLDVNLTGLFLVTQAVGRALIEQRSGAIVNVASMAALTGMPNNAAYVASKHGVAGLTKALAIEWARYGIRVNAVCPGLTDTEMLRDIARQSPGLLEGRAASLLLGRLAEPDEQAAVIAFLASPDASYLNGAIINVDGGNLSLYAGYEPPRDG